VIADDGAQLGVMNPLDAVKLAREKGLDLVEVAPQANPPVCRIMDFNRFKYEQQRREREAKKKHHIAKLKEVKFKPHIEEHDYHVKVNMLKRFLERGDKAKVTLVFRGRELSHVDIGRKVLERVTKDLAGVGIVERTPILEGRFMTMIIQPDHAAIKKSEKKSHSKADKDATDEPSEPPSNPALPVQGSENA